MTARVIALCNQKGGVGKTTLTVNLAQTIADTGRRVLVIDADPQANATTNLGVVVEDDTLTLNDVLTVEPRTGRVRAGSVVDAATPAGEGWNPLIEVVPAERGLATREQDQNLGREYRLREALSGTLEQWDVVLIDCPPSIGPLTVTALAAADAALLVTEPRAASVDGVAQIVATLDLIRMHFNAGLEIAGVVINRHNTQRVDRTDWAATIQATYGDLVLDPFVPEREAISQATSGAVPVSTIATESGRSVTAALQLIADLIAPATVTS
ncbi:ParA family protein [Modestobacter muralis]|uniref:ParA family protein n=1 Tax=Modestobacter muralis TaxID=1608614 RepID=A0A6P0HD09_9ACTN|nr:ParA family protein [Modestobacter muralis]NEK96601.1 ParA family protein [Modestobacter muralis]NEN53520.1 ParA family protein [Modestobacter muralis]